ncbi:sensor histidine kinase [Cohnella endophytica]|uniref:histidine kinase n=1 Tax=Cohnella endophytica TaxID=2419778 RepID=A0A494XLQ1_9BACL|nr:HAMP domain-containing sensor histidine kinase [Cohnella endophytica]RKP51625.1 sensor histidine kinase [Cohnella endophytica]
MANIRIFRFLIPIITLYLLLPQQVFAQDIRGPVVIREWEVQWILDTPESLEATRPADGAWNHSGNGNSKTGLAEHARGMWVRIDVPPTNDWQRPGLLIDRLYGLELSVYEKGKLLYESKRSLTVDLNKLLMSFTPSSEHRQFDLRIVTTSQRAGIISDIRIGDFHSLSERFVTRELPDLLLGTSIAFLALIMLLCSGYLRRNQRRSWISLCLIALTTGTLIVVYSPLPYIYFKQYGSLMLRLFDLSLFVLFPALNYYIDQVFEGQYRFFTKFRHAQTIYSGICVVCLAIYATDMKRFYEMYYLVSIVIMSVFILVQLLLIITLTIVNAVRGNKNAIILSIGILLLALSGILDLIFYYLSERRYVLFLWKFGVIFMMIALVIILARRISADYAKLVTYSKELELYNHRLQRSEKLKIISDLAASVAHEVRNPLQVTRGFLQLLASRTDEKDKPYFELATNELDRASEIITDFLTFAKPELENIVLLDLTKEIRKIEAIMIPMAAMHGGILSCRAEDSLYIYGNSTKLKQALINMIKNSIEAIGKDGTVEVQAIAEGDEAVVRISDNGQGMEEDEVAKLGVPFFSTKTKGTGLGLMVTYRIIEVMKGTIKVRSAKGKGTEFTIRFPLTVQDIVLPDELNV